MAKKTAKAALLLLGPAELPLQSRKQKLLRATANEHPKSNQAGAKKQQRGWFRRRAATDDPLRTAFQGEPKAVAIRQSAREVDRQRGPSIVAEGNVWSLVTRSSEAAVQVRSRACAVAIEAERTRGAGQRDGVNSSSAVVRNSDQRVFDAVVRVAVACRSSSNGDRSSYATALSRDGDLYAAIRCRASCRADAGVSRRCHEQKHEATESRVQNSLCYSVHV